MNNRLGINLWNWVNGLGPDCVGLPTKAAKMGFTAIELPMTCPEVDEALADEIARQGLEVSLCAALGPGRDLSNFDEIIRNRTMEYMTACLKTAEQVGARIFAGPLYTGGGKRHFLSDEDKKREWDLAVTGIQELSRRAEEFGVRLALEPLNRYRTSVINTVDQMLALVADIGKENVGVHFDTFHAGIEEDDLTGAMARVLKQGKLYHFHACSNNRGAPGQGFFPWNTIWNLLREYGYDGHITMETFAPGGLDSGWIWPEMGPDQVALTGLRYMKEQALKQKRRNINGIT